MDGWVSIGTKLDTKNFDAQIEQVQRKLEDIEATLEIGESGVFKLTESEMVDLNAEAEKLRNRLKSLKDQQDKLGKSNLVSVKRIMEDIGNSTGKVIKQVGRWTLAIFGVRAVYSFVRNSINTIANDNEQLKTDIDYMSNALAYSIEPIIKKIVDLAKQLMFYLAYLIKEWTGKNIFENANKSLKGANKQAKDLQKTMAGFDEMNVVGGGSSGGGGAGTPSFDLNSIEEMEEPKWLLMIRDIGQWIIDNWQQVVFGLLLTKLFIDLLTGNWIGVIISFVGLLISAFFQLKDAIIAIYENGKIIFGMFVEWIYNKVIKPIGDFFAGLWNGFTSGASKAWEGVKKVFSTVPTFFKNVFSTAWNAVKAVFSTGGKIFDGIKDGIVTAFKTVVNAIITGLNKVISAPFEGLNTILNKIHKIKIAGIEPFSWLTWRAPIVKIPKLAVGGVVNMPGRGVNYMGANIGERGPEGVIPLTNSQMMSELGKAIGQYVTINANITNTMNGRVISRELQKVNSSSDFAFNR